MLMVMDVGNTHTVLGIFDGEKLISHWRVMTTNYRTGDELRILIAMLMHNAHIETSAIEGVCVASVVPQLSLGIQHASQIGFGLDPLMVGPGIKTGLVLQCENPKEVGADRIVNSVGAIAEYEGPLIIIDFGTATTFDAVTAKAEWRGGVIVPGIHLAADALFEHCAKLPRVEFTVPPNVIGRDTVSNIRAGLTYGYADMVDGLVRRMAEEMEGTPTVIATGGLAGHIAGVAQRIDHVDDMLTLRGLRVVYERNTKAGAA